MAITKLSDLGLQSWFDFSLPDACEVDHTNLLLSIKDQITQTDLESIGGSPTWGNRRINRKRAVQLRNNPYRSSVADVTQGDWISFADSLPSSGTITVIVTSVLDFTPWPGVPNYDDASILSNSAGANLLMIDGAGGWNSVAMGAGATLFGSTKHETEIVVGQAYTYLLEWHAGDTSTSELWVNGFKLADTLNLTAALRNRLSTGYNTESTGSDRIFEGAYCELAIKEAALTDDEKRDVFEQQRKKWYPTASGKCGVAI